VYVLNYDISIYKYSRVGYPTHTFFLFPFLAAERRTAVEVARENENPPC
jgi:hypothetical protein